MAHKLSPMRRAKAAHRHNLREREFRLPRPHTFVMRTPADEAFSVYLRES